MIHLLHLLRLYNNEHNLSRYIRFIQSRSNIKGKGMHRHHILPKAHDFFPEFRNLKIHKWNCIYLTPREHHIAHRMLHRAFPGSSQTFAFYNMSNEQKRMRSRDYDTSKQLHIERLKVFNKSPERCAKLSKALKGKPKSEAHIRALTGHVVTEETRQKLRIFHTGRKASAESRDKMVKTRTGLKRGEYKDGTKRNISISRMSFKINTPFGIFHSFFDLAEATNIPNRSWIIIFNRNLDKIPRPKFLTIMGLSNPNKLTWNQLGFGKLPL